MTDDELHRINEKMKAAFYLHREIHNLKDALAIAEKSGLEGFSIRASGCFDIGAENLSPEARDELVKTLLKVMRWTLSDKEKEYKQIAI